MFTLCFRRLWKSDKLIGIWWRNDVFLSIMLLITEDDPLIYISSYIILMINFKKVSKEEQKKSRSKSIYRGN